MRLQGQVLIVTLIFDELLSLQWTYIDLFVLIVLLSLVVLSNFTISTHLNEKVNISPIPLIFIDNIIRGAEPNVSSLHSFKSLPRSFQVSPEQRSTKESAADVLLGTPLRIQGPCGLLYPLEARVEP